MSRSLCNSFGLNKKVDRFRSVEVERGAHCSCRLPSCFLLLPPAFLLPAPAACRLPPASCSCPLPSAACLLFLVHRSARVLPGDKTAEQCSRVINPFASKSYRRTGGCLFRRSSTVGNDHFVLRQLTRALLNVIKGN